LWQFLYDWRFKSPVGIAAPNVSIQISIFVECLSVESTDGLKEPCDLYPKTDDLIRYYVSVDHIILPFVFY